MIIKTIQNQKISFQKNHSHLEEGYVMLNVIWQHLEIPYMTYMSDIILYSFNFYFNTRSSHTPCLFLKSDRVQCKR